MSDERTSYLVLATVLELEGYGLWTPHCQARRAYALRGVNVRKNVRAAAATEQQRGANLTILARMKRSHNAMKIHALHRCCLRYVSS
jgi:hypothetical protein